jgi:hypothetical protein
MPEWERRQRIVLAVGFLASVAASSGLVGREFAYQTQPIAQQMLLIFLLPITATALRIAVRTLQRPQLLLADARTPDPAIQGIVFWIIFFLVGTHALVLSVLVGIEIVQPWAARAVIILGGVSLIATGNLLPQTRPNLALGIRTTRSLVDRHFWMRLHRTAGYICVLVGFVTLTTTIFLSAPAIASITGGALLAGVAIVSFYYYRITHAADPGSRHSRISSEHAQ